MTAKTWNGKRDHAQKDRRVTKVLLEIINRAKDGGQLGKIRGQRRYWHENFVEGFISTC